jgi:mannose-6-phosphate isomerase-like protein (cupin superfamily)
VTESQCIPVVGAVQVQSEGKTHQVERGCRFTLEGNKKHTLHAAGANVLLLELRRGTGFSAKPLKEVTEERPWGSFTVLKDEPEYKLKQLLVRPACRLSLQRHFKREEHWFITRGKPEISLDETQHRLEPGGYIHIPLQSWHRIANPVDASVPVEIIELQLGDYFGEDDIERSQDDYGRR